MDSQVNYSLKDMDRASLFHPVSSIHDQQTNGASIYMSGDGVELTTEDGRRLIDLGAGLWCVNVGYGRAELADAAAHAMKTLSFQHLFGGAASEPAVRLADRLLGLFREQAEAPHMARVFFGTSGSDANDTAFKLVRYYNNLRGKPQKKKIISRVGGYHGVTYASGSLTGISAYHKAFDLPVDGVLHASCPHHYTFGHPGESEEAFSRRLVLELETMIEREGGETIAAFIAEPVMGTGGVLLPPKGYFEGVQALLDKHHILLIVDEVITGFGRLGHWFGTGAYRLRPDIVSLAKGLTSAYFPMSASIISTRIWDTLKEASASQGAFMHGFTYSGHPVGAAVALANLDVMEREKLVERAHELGCHFLDALRQKIGGHRFVGDIRGQGLMIGIEYVQDKETKQAFAPEIAPHRIVAKHAANAGVLTRALPFIPVNSFSPPLTITKTEIDTAIDRFSRALAIAESDIAERL